jgi:hypothetical protein
MCFPLCCAPLPPPRRTSAAAISRNMLVELHNRSRAHDDHDDHDDRDSSGCSDAYDANSAEDGSASSEQDDDEEEDSDGGADSDEFGRRVVPATEQRFQSKLLPDPKRQSLVAQLHARSRRYDLEHGCCAWEQ